ncbi:ABC transporter ATP-binding protein [Sphingobacterium rhinopitheci]|nr:ABC transporter ATP-binding protein [Sphingobacterium rhinopitheci]
MVFWHKSLYMDNLLLKTENLSFGYSKSIPPIVFKDLQIAVGNHLLLLGNSGTGKTTLLNLLSGLSKPTQGKVWINNIDIYELQSSKLDTFRGQHIGFIFQEAHLIKNLTIEENIRLAQNLAKKKENKEAVLEVLEKVQLKDKANSYPDELSRGQLQRAAIARAVINGPMLLVADEPTAALDDTNTQLVLDLLLQTASTYGATLLIATHDKRIKDHFANTYQL